MATIVDKAETGGRALPAEPGTDRGQDRLAHAGGVGKALADATGTHNALAYPALQ